MPDNVIQCGNCGHETPAESIYCENCGTYLKAAVPERPDVTWGFDVQGSPVSKEAAEFLMADLPEKAPSSTQLTTPPPFADIVGLNGGYFEPESELDDKEAAKPRFEPESKDVFESVNENAFTGENHVEVVSGVGSNGEYVRETQSAPQSRGPYYSLEGYIGPATLETQLPSIPSFQLNDDEYSPVDPQSAPYQPKLGAFRILVVGLMAVLFGIAIVLLFCLVVMRLLGF